MLADLRMLCWWALVTRVRGGSPRESRERPAARCNRSSDTIGKKHVSGTLRALPWPPAALSRAGPSYSSSPAPLTPRARPCPSCGPTAVPSSRVCVNEAMTFAGYASCTGHSRGVKRNSNTHHMATSVAISFHVMAMASRARVAGGILCARTSAARQPECKVSEGGRGRRGHGRCRHDGRAQPYAAQGMAWAVE